MHTLRYGPKMQVNTEQKEVTNHQGLEFYEMPPVILATGYATEEQDVVTLELNTNVELEMFPAPPCILAEVKH